MKAGYSPAITDFILMVKNTSYMFVTGPDGIKTVTHEEVTKEDLGGAMSHNERSGVAHFAAEDEKECLFMIRELLSFLPQNNMEDPPLVTPKDSPDRRDGSLNQIVPDIPTKPYDIRDVIRKVVDDGYFFEVQEHYARNIVIGFARMNGRSVGIIKHGAKLLYAFAESTVPKVTVITRKAYGGAYDVMASKHIRADVNFAYPTAEIAVMGPDGAVNIIFRKELVKSDNPEKTKAELVADYRARFASPYKAAELGFVDEVIMPEETRPKVIRAFEMLSNKRETNPPRKHGNIPL